VEVFNWAETIVGTWNVWSRQLFLVGKRGGGGVAEEARGKVGAQRFPDLQLTVRVSLVMLFSWPKQFHIVIVQWNCWCSILFIPLH
jgi:hypothetical protein